MYLAAMIIMIFEGFEPKAYKDPVGIWTVGYGTIVYHDGTEVKEHDTMDKQTAEAYMYSHMSNDYIRIAAYGEQNGYVWNEMQLAALTSFTYNVGWDNFLQLTANATRTNAEIETKIPLYKKAKGKVLNGLIRRRNTELCVFKSINYEKAMECLK